MNHHPIVDRIRPREDEELLQSPAQRRRRRVVENEEQQPAENQDVPAPEAHFPPVTFMDVVQTSDVWNHLLLFLGPKDILTTCAVSRSMRDSITYDSVVRSVLLPRSSGGPNTPIKKRLLDIVALVHTESIHLPTPLRVLRLLLGIQCERMEQCVHYDAAAGTAARVLPELVSQPKQFTSDLQFGTHYCQACADTAVCLAPCNLLWVMDGSSVRQRRLFWNQNRPDYAAVTQFEHATGDAIGPIMTEQRLGTDLDTLTATQEYQQGRAALRQAYAQVLEEVQNQKEAEQVRLGAVRVQRHATKIENQRKVLERLDAALDETPYPFTALMMRTRVGDDGLTSFQNGLSNILMGNFLSAPSKWTKTKIAAELVRIMAAYETLDSYGFLEGSDRFMESPNVEPNGAVEEIVYNYAKEELLHFRDVKTIKTEALYQSINDYLRLETPNPVGFLFSLWPVAKMEDGIIRYLTSDSYGHQQQLAPTDPLLALAKYCWSYISKEDFSGDPSTITDADQLRTLGDFWSTYMSFSARWNTYTQQPVVMSWLASDAENPTLRQSKESALRGVNDRVIHMLHGEQYESLLEYHNTRAHAQQYLALVSDAVARATARRQGNA